MVSAVYRSKDKKDNPKRDINSVDGFLLIYDIYSRMHNGDGVSGTIRTTPENYYVATINENGEILFQDTESMTRAINKSLVEKLWNEKLIPVKTPNDYDK